MGNRLFSYSRYLFFMLIFIYQAAFAYQNDFAYESIARQTEVNPKIECKLKLSDLDYVGVGFDGDAVCVAAKTDAQALIKCGTGSLIVNPGNPQYSENAKGSYNENPEGYYYCLKNKTKRNKKQNMCENLAQGQSKYLNGETDPAKRVNFKWFSYNLNNKKADGVCVCGIGEYLEGGGYRDCAQNGPTIADDPKKPEAPKEEKPPVVEAVHKAADPDKDLVSCVDEWKKAADQCKATADDAKKTCDPKSENAAQTKDINDAIGAVTNGYTNLKSGSGAQQECFKASLLGSSASGLLTLQSDSCESKVDLCTSSCGEELDKKKKTCDDIMAKIIKDHEHDPNSNADNSPITVNSQVYTEGINYVDEKSKEGEKICGTDAKKDQSTLSSMLDSVGHSMAASLKCMCQLSSGASVDCNKIVTPQACGQNPTAVGCSVYGSIAVCTPGAGYDARLCNCQMNPKDAGCPGGTLSGGLANFAGSGLKGNAISGGGGDPNIMAGNLKPTGNYDLAIGGDPSGTTASLQLGPGSGSDSSQGGGGSPSGGGGPSGGGDPSAAAPGAPPEEKGIGGLFNQAKSFVSKAFGNNKSSSNSNSKNGKNANGFDPNKFRPTRGIASKRGIGSKNQDIWKMSNDCMYAVTCQSNMNNFMDSPLRLK